MWVKYRNILSLIHQYQYQWQYIPILQEHYFHICYVTHEYDNSIQHKIQQVGPHFTQFGRCSFYSYPSIPREFVNLLFNGTSTLFKLVVPRIVEIKQMRLVKNFRTNELLKNDLRQTSSTYRNNVDVDILFLNEFTSTKDCSYQFLSAANLMKQKQRHTFITELVKITR